MSSVNTTRCWFKLEAKTFGPANCELIEDITVTSHGTTRYQWYGTFNLDPEADALPFMASEFEILLEDGRYGHVLFDNLHNFVSGSFRVQGDLK